MKVLLLALVLVGCGASEESNDSAPLTTEQILEKYKDEPKAYYLDEEGRQVAFKDSISQGLPRLFNEGEYRLMEEMSECHIDGFCSIKRACYWDSIQSPTVLTCYQHIVYIEDDQVIKVETEALTE